MKKIPIVFLCFIAMIQGCYYISMNDYYFVENTKSREITIKRDSLLVFGLKLIPEVLDRLIIQTKIKSSHPIDIDTFNVEFYNEMNEEFVKRIFDITIDTIVDVGSYYKVNAIDTFKKLRFYEQNMITFPFNGQNKSIMYEYKINSNSNDYRLRIIYKIKYPDIELKGDTLIRVVRKSKFVYGHITGHGGEKILFD